MLTGGSVLRAVTFVLSLLSVQNGLAADVRRPVTSLLEMRQKNVVIQKYDLSCGAAALATLLNYQHGIWSPSGKL